MDKQDIREIPNYSVVEVSNYLRMPVSTLRAWVRGQPNFKPLIKIAQTNPPNLSFNNLIEIYILHALTREYKIPMRKLRKGLKYVKKYFQSERPLLDKNFATDGLNLFLKESEVIYDVSSELGQVQMNFIKTYLERIERDQLGLPIRLYPFSRTGKPEDPKLISIAPEYSFGRPVIDKKKIPVDIVAERYLAGETTDELAEDYNVSEAEIDEAIRYELGFTKAA